VDIFTCGETINPWMIQQYLAEHFQAKNTSSMELKRGLFTEPVKHKPDFAEASYAA
jgi:S-adenosylmethionine decarboxylase